MLSMFHPLFVYPTLLLSFVVYALYIVGTLKGSGPLKTALYLNALLVVLALLSVLTGFDVSKVPLVQSKMPFILGFPHKWNGIFMLVVALVNLVVFWFKREGSGKKLMLLPALGMVVTLFQLFTGWMLRLVFFS